MRSFNSFLRESIEPINDISHWSRVGHRLGSNEGAVHYSPEGEKHYVKFGSRGQIQSELAAARIYERVGAHTDKPFAIMKNGVKGIAKKWIDGIKPWGHEPSTLLSSPPPHISDQLADHFHAAVLTKNWDAVGDDHTNLQHEKYKRLIAIDHGGTFDYRAQGDKKNSGYDDYPSEMRTLKDGTNSRTTEVFGHLSNEVLRTSAHRLTQIPEQEFHRILSDHGLTHHWPSFKSRLDYIKTHYN